MPTIYDKGGEAFNTGAVIDRMGELSREVDDELDKDEVDRERLLKLRTAQLMVGMRLSTRYGAPRLF